MATSQKIDIVRQLGELGVWMLSLSGGEPFLMDDIYEVIKKAKKNKILLNITTNGYFLKENAEKIINQKVDFLTVSLDADNAKEHDENRGLNGLFNRALDGIKYIKKQRKGKKPFISIRCIVHGGNIGRIGKIIDFLKNYGDEVLLQPIHSSERINFMPEKNMLEITEKDANLFISALKKRNMLNSYNKMIPKFLKNPTSIKTKCFSMYFFIEIDENGLLWNCGEHIIKLGDLKKDSLKSILKSSRYGEIKSEFEKKRNCICWHNCAMLNAYLSKVLK